MPFIIIGGFAPFVAFLPTKPDDTYLLTLNAACFALAAMNFAIALTRSK